VIHRLLLLIGGAAAFWLLAGLPARALGGGDRALIFCGAAVLLCLPPMAASLVWVGWAQTRAPYDQLIAVVGGTVARMMFVLAGALILALAVPYFQGQLAFWIWLLVVYMAALALDVALILAGRPAPKP
jgi:hypothetical protein